MLSDVSKTKILFHGREHMKRIIILLIICIFLSACTPTEAQIQTALAQTEEAKPTSTDTNLPTNMHTITPSLTPSLTPSQTLTQTHTQTLTFTHTQTNTATPTLTPDLRIIIGDPEDYILLKEDVPIRYILHAGDSTPHNNSEILSVRGIEEGKAYLDSTGRLSGWIIYYGRDDNTAIAPEWIRSYIVMYDSNEGPRIAKEEWDWDDEDIEFLDIAMDLGDWNRTRVYKERSSGGKYYLRYAIEFYYRSIWAEIMVWGWESEIKHEFVENAARAVLEKLKNAPLSNSKQ